MRILVVDDEKPAVTQMQWLLESEPLAESVHSAHNAAQAKHILSTQPIDVVLLDIHMPGQSGMELARQLTEKAVEGQPAPQIIFITADAQPAVEAFELAARDYLLKPVRASRLREALTRASEALTPEPGGSAPAPPRIPVSRGDSTVLLELPAIRRAEAQGDYARLHTDRGSFLLRAALSDLEEQWGPHGFVRIHRSHLVSLHHVERVQQRSGRMSIRVAGEDLDVSRRLMPQVRDRLASVGR
ncbi:LytR/AlgR family response regulator transcription factor [Nesterenkonia flava]|uniref:LytTR family DNA-binding domain-containing protein n=1 Tax=Nesterenkonia flava TaxID=469799 RepID=A0ABU1FR69_9MICC|nr:LytTR family DNA-binding domain-containing protein [Nesterenkonia flava]MDR5711113.1 LytTR family DNA-binding domain-containing protein [Nesterenkonia flava]